YLELTGRLGGVLAPRACFIVGGPLSSSDNGWPTYSQVLHFTPAIPHGGAHSATGVAVFDVATAKPNTLPLDTVVFGGGDSGGRVRWCAAVTRPAAWCDPMEGWLHPMLPTRWRATVWCAHRTAGNKRRFPRRMLVCPRNRGLTRVFPRGFVAFVTINSPFRAL